MSKNQFTELAVTWECGPLIHVVFNFTSINGSDTSCNTGQHLVKILMLVYWQFLEMKINKGRQKGKGRKEERKKEIKKEIKKERKTERKRKEEKKKERKIDRQKERKKERKKDR